MPKPLASFTEMAGRVIKRVVDRLQSEPDASEIWRQRSDGQVIAAMMRLDDYEEEGRKIIRAEIVRRGLLSLPNPDHPGIHVYVVQNPAGGMMEIASVLPMDVVFTNGLVIESIVGRFHLPGAGEARTTPESFGANPVFADFLHDVIARHGPDEPDLIEKARRLGAGRVDVVDGRTPTPDGTVLPADILGSFGVDGGVIVAGSYERNPNHTVLSATGFFRLSPALHERLTGELARRTTHSVK